jgi:hypothetical protein
MSFTLLLVCISLPVKGDQIEFKRIDAVVIIKISRRGKSKDILQICVPLIICMYLFLVQKESKCDIRSNRLFCRQFFRNESMQHEFNNTMQAAMLCSSIEDQITIAFYTY